MTDKVVPRPVPKIPREAMTELNRPIPPVEPARSIPIPPPADAAARAPRKLSRGKARKGKLQLVLPALLLWKLKIAAANEGLTVGQLMMRFVAEPLKSYSYPTIPDWLKKMGESGDESSVAA